MQSFFIEFQPIGLRGQCRSDQSLLECAREIGADLIGLCAGSGACGRCRIQIISGQVSEVTAADREVFYAQEIDEGWRLACLAYPESEVVVNVPADSLSTPQRLQVEGLEPTAVPSPVVQAYGVSLTPPSLEDTAGDDERLYEALRVHHGIECRYMDTEMIRELSPRLRSCNWSAEVIVHGEEAIDLLPPGFRRLGIAVDLGTTKIAGYLVDLESGQTLSAQGRMNPQIAYGEDVISRIVMAQKSPAEALKMQEILVETLNELSAALCSDEGVEMRDVKDMVIVGNTAMHHLLLRLPVSQLCLAPYIPAVRRSLNMKARDLGLSICQGAYVHLPSNIAGYVGGDHVAMLLAVEAGEAKSPLLAIDIGTNTEISLAVGGELFSVSCASGPAFEGYHIKCGMRAAAGAIEHVKISEDKIDYYTIHGAEPVGICGSGIFDTMAQLYLNGIIDKSGMMIDAHSRVRSNGSSREFVLVGEEESGATRAITVTQKDVRELQLAKAAIRTGIEVLLEKHRISAEGIGQVVVAGAFGSFLDISSAITIGMFPKLPLDRFHQVGNAAGAGARSMLISHERREAAKLLTDRIRYVELANAPEFNATFLRSLELGR